MDNRNFLSGLEEAFARLIAACLSFLLFFAFWSGGYKAEEALTPTELVVQLLVFWLIYEVFGFILFVFFKFFSKANAESKAAQNSTETQPNTIEAISNSDNISDVDASNANNN